jgi:hypothetical protein
MSDWPQRDFLIQNHRYFNRIITNSSFIITSRIRTIGQRARHIANKLNHMVSTYSHVDHQLIHMTKAFLRVFNTEGDYEPLKDAMIRRGYMNDEDDDTSSVEVQREEPRRNEDSRINDPNLLLFIAYREWSRGDIDTNEYDSRMRWLTREILRQRGLAFTADNIERSLPAIRERQRRFFNLSSEDSDMPRLEAEPQRYPIDAFVESMIIRSNVKITDWKEEKPSECPVCCGDCDENPLSCGHYVCSDCIVNSKKATCPCCRQDVALDVPVYQRLYNAIYN